MPLFLIPLLKFFMGPLGKVAAGALIAAAVLVAVLIAIREHDNGIRAQDRAAATQAAAAAMLHHADAVIQALQANAVEQQQRQQELDAARVEIANAPAPPVACVAPAALVAAFRLLPAANPSGGPAAHPGQPVDLHGRPASP